MVCDFYTNLWASWWAAADDVVKNDPYASTNDTFSVEHIPPIQEIPNYNNDASLCFWTFWANSADDKLNFYTEIRLWHFIPLETIAWNVKICFPEKSKKNIWIYSLLKILPSVLRVKTIDSSAQITNS